MKQSMAARISAGIGFLGVTLGAFGAHGLSAVLTEHKTTAIWEKAVLYHLIHAVMLVVLSRSERFDQAAWKCFLAGIAIFSGSLYLLAALNLRWMGAITPIGGVAFLAGWFFLARQSVPSKPANP